MLVGAYLKWVEECDIIAYGEHSRKNKQGEVDVIGIQPKAGQKIIACEVATHIGDSGLGYGNAQQNRDTVERKVRNAEEHVTQVFPSAESYSFQFWSPKVGNKSANLLEEAATEFKDDTGHELKLVMNEKYTKNISDLQDKAKTNTSQQSELAFRLLQILENLQE